MISINNSYAPPKDELIILGLNIAESLTIAGNEASPVLKMAPPTASGYSPICVAGHSIWNNTGDTGQHLVCPVLCYYAKGENLVYFQMRNTSSTQVKVTVTILILYAKG